MKGVKIRKAARRDFESYFKLLKELHEYSRGLYGKYFHSFFEWVEERKVRACLKKEFLRDLKRKNICMFVAEYWGRIIGYAIVYSWMKGKYFKIRKIGTLADLYVTEKYRGKGIGKMLKEECFKWMREKKLVWTGLYVLCPNKLVIKTYRRWGYKLFDIYMIRRV